MSASLYYDDYSSQMCNLINATISGQNQNHGDHKSDPLTKRHRSNRLMASDGERRARHCCPACDRTFVRLEHMIRHAATHNPHKPFKCLRCDKGFHRPDVMRKHEMIHGRDIDSAKSKGFRACDCCAAAKVGCSGGAPCTRCFKKVIECRYPDTSMKQGEVTNPDTTSSWAWQPLQQNLVLSSTTKSSPQSREIARSAMLSRLSNWPKNAASSTRLFQDILDASLQPESKTHYSWDHCYSDTVNQTSNLDTCSNSEAENSDAFLPIDNTASPDVGLEFQAQSKHVDSRHFDVSDIDTSQHTSNISQTYLDGGAFRLLKAGLHKQFNSRLSLSCPKSAHTDERQSETITLDFPPYPCHSNPHHISHDHGIVNDYDCNEIRGVFGGNQPGYSPFAQMCESPDFSSYDGL